jgi:hypothetical protein
VQYGRPLDGPWPALYAAGHAYLVCRDGIAGRRGRATAHGGVWPPLRAADAGQLAEACPEYVLGTFAACR